MTDKAMSQTNTTDWTDDADEVLLFARELDDAGAFSDTRDVIRYFESPHDWTPEHTRWVRLDRPGFSRETRNEWDVILDAVSVSCEAEEALEADDLHGSHVEPAMRRELLEAGLVQVADVPEHVRGTYYEVSELGRVYVETRP